MTMANKIGDACGWRRQARPKARLAALWLSAALMIALAVPAQAQNANIVETRQAGLKELGTAFKNLNDELKKPAPLKIMVRSSVSTIRRNAQEMAAWFPAGSGPGEGVKTKAKPEIWTDPAAFASAQDKFRKAADDLAAASAADDMDAVRAQAKALGATCKACHEKFHAED